MEGMFVKYENGRAAQDVRVCACYGDDEPVVGCHGESMVRGGGRG